MGLLTADQVKWQRLNDALAQAGNPNLDNPGGPSQSGINWDSIGNVDTSSFFTPAQFAGDSTTTSREDPAALKAWLDSNGYNLMGASGAEATGSSRGSGVGIQDGKGNWVVQPQMSGGDPHFFRDAALTLGGGYLAGSALAGAGGAGVGAELEALGLPATAAEQMPINYLTADQFGAGLAAAATGASDLEAAGLTADAATANPANYLTPEQMPKFMPSITPPATATPPVSAPPATAPTGTTPPVTTPSAPTSTTSSPLDDFSKWAKDPANAQLLKLLFMGGGAALAGGGGPSGGGGYVDSGYRPNVQRGGFLASVAPTLSQPQSVAPRGLISMPGTKGVANSGLWQYGLLGGK